MEKPIDVIGYIIFLEIRPNLFMTLALHVHCIIFFSMEMPLEDIKFCIFLPWNSSGFHRGGVRTKNGRVYCKKNVNHKWHSFNLFATAL